MAGALTSDGPHAAAHELARLVEAFGREHVAVELWDHGDPLDSARNDALVQLALRAGVDPVATNNVHYATPARRPLATALSAVRARRSLDEIDGLLTADDASNSMTIELKDFAPDDAEKAPIETVTESTVGEDGEKVVAPDPEV